MGGMSPTDKTMKILDFTIKRILMLLPVLLGVTILTFAVSHIMPSNPAAVALGPHATKETIKAFNYKWGLDQPLYIQYFRYVKNLCKGDLGTSMHTLRPVKKDLMAFFPATFELTASSLLFCLVLGIPIGVISAIRKDHLIDHISRFFSLFGVSIPVFWLGLLMLLVFYFQFDWFPGGGRLSATSAPPPHISGLYTVDSLLAGDWSKFKESLLHLIMPVTCLGFAVTGIISRMTRSSMLNVSQEQYMKTAEAKGLSRVRVIFLHALINAILPVITVSGVLFGQLLAGAVLTETIFAWPGMGLYIVTAIMHFDFQPIMGFTILVAIVYVLINLIVDILYVLIDPRITLE